jgi:hypothetical protein
MPRWKLSDGVGSEGCGWASGGEKWDGAADAVVHDGSGVVKGCGPFRKEEASERDWERRRSWAERNCGGGGGMLSVVKDGGGDDWEPVVADGVVEGEG